MSDMLPDERLAEIEACERGTRPGPWTLRDANEGDGWPPRPHWVIGTPEQVEDDWSVSVDVGDEAVGAFIAMARTAVPELLAEVKRLSVELAKYTSWEPTVREEYEHACGQLNAVQAVVDAFARGAQLGVNRFVADLKNALEMP